MASSLAGLTICALCLAGCGGTEDTPRPKKPTLDDSRRGLDLSSCSEVAEAFEFQRIEDFEDGPVKDTGTGAGWWVSSDGSNEGNFSPFDYEPATSCQTSPSGPNDCQDLFPREGGAPDLFAEAGQCEPSGHAMKLESRPPGFSGWGLTFGSNLNGTGDGTEWDGIAFWAKHGPESDVTSFTAKLPDAYTSNQGDTYLCRDGLEVENLCDPFGRGIDATDEWRFYLLPFDALSQQGFGLVSPLGELDVANILGISFEIGAGTWEIWVDEVVFYREK